MQLPRHGGPSGMELGAAALPEPVAMFATLSLIGEAALARHFASLAETDSLALKAELVRRAGYESIGPFFDRREAARSAASGGIVALLASASEKEAELRKVAAKAA